MKPFALAPGKAACTPYDRYGETKVCITATASVNVIVFEIGRYPDGPKLVESADRKWHEFTFTAPRGQWDLVIENQGKEHVGGAFSVTYMDRVTRPANSWGFW